MTLQTLYLAPQCLAFCSSKNFLFKSVYDIDIDTVHSWNLSHQRATVTYNNAVCYRCARMRTYLYSRSCILVLHFPGPAWFSSQFNQLCPIERQIDASQYRQRPGASSQLMSISFKSCLMMSIQFILSLRDCRFAVFAPRCSLLP